MLSLPRRALVWFSLFAVAPGTAAAAERIWSGGLLGGGQFTSVNSWFDSVVPANDTTSDLAVFLGFTSGPPNTTVNLSEARSVRGIYFAPPDGIGAPINFTFSGSALTLGSAGVQIAAGAGSTQTFNNNLTLANDQIWNIDTNLRTNGGISGSGNLRKQGDGTLTWASSSSHAGALDIEDGLVLVTGAGRISDQSDVIVRSSATLRFNGMTDAINGLSGTGTVDLQNSATLVVGNSINNSQGVGNFFGTIQGTGGELIKRGPGTFSIRGHNTYTGGTRVENGILSVHNSLATSATGPGPVVVANGGTLGGSGAVAGMVTVQAGGMVAPSGDLSPLADDTDRLTLTDLTLAAESTLQIDLGGSEPGETFDVLAVANVILAGSLEVRLVDGFTPSYGQEFQFLTISEGGTGLFTGLPQGDLVGEFGGTELFIDYTGGGGHIVSLRAGQPGDYNANGMVDAADYTVWRNELGTKFSHHDYLVWRNHYGESDAGHATSNFAIPEPSSAIMLLLLLAIGVGSRRPRLSFLPLVNR